MRSTEEEQIPRWQELAQLAADGEATPAQLSDLEAAIAQSPEAGQFARSIQQLVTELRAMDTMEPVRPLAAGVIAQLRMRVNPQRRESAYAGPAPAARRRLIAGIGWGVAAAVVTVIALLPAIQHRSSRAIAPADVAGSIAGVHPQSWPAVSRMSTDGISVTVRRSGTLASIELAVPAEMTPPVTLRWDPAQMRPAGSWPEGAGVMREAGDARFTWEGAVRGGVLVRPLQPAAQIAVESADGPILKTTVSLQ